MGEGGRFAFAGALAGDGGDHAGCEVHLADAVVLGVGDVEAMAGERDALWLVGRGLDCGPAVAGAAGLAGAADGRDGAGREGGHGGQALPSSARIRRPISCVPTILSGGESGDWMSFVR